MNDELRVEVPPEPLDTGNPIIARALLDMLRRFTETGHLDIPEVSGGIYGNRSRKNRATATRAALEETAG